MSEAGPLRNEETATAGDDIAASRDVLFIDDDRGALEGFQRLLARENCTVHSTAQPSEALEMLNHREFAVVIADYLLPGMDGIRLLEEIGRAQPDAIRMLVTGVVDFETALRAINRVGIFRFVPKPWNAAQLRSWVRQALLRYRSVRESHTFAARLEVANRELQHINRMLDATVAERTAQVLMSLCNALDARDNETEGHSRRVALYTRRLASEVGVGEAELLDIERGALLHDIGKIGVSDAILLKPAKLTDDEWIRMRLHVELGAKMLDGIPFLERARLLVQQHHERWDGSGYARGLKGTDIYIGARVFSVIDAYDAITSDRPYRKARSYAEAVQEIRRNIGSQFDPDVVETFCAIPEEDLEFLCAVALTGASQ